ncbi:hypothetical protein V8C42DRAFT_330844 [Trichoderma barbatum]
MEPTLYEIDPNGDTLLVLLRANAPFAELPLFSMPQEERTQSASTPGDDAADKSQEAGSKAAVYMRLSSKHLTLASAHFQKLAANNWKQTPEADYSTWVVNAKGWNYRYQFSAHSWDEEAVRILMDILHGRTAKVPREVKLEMLAKIAVLVEYYQCHEAVGFFAQTWLSIPSIQQVHGVGQRNYMLRLVASLVFPENESRPFLMLTEKIIQKSSGPIVSLGLPIRQDVINALNKRREDAIFHILAGLGGIKKRLCEDKEPCSFECSSIYLGALYKAMDKMNIVEPHPFDPYHGLSIWILEQSIRSIREPDWKSNCLRQPAPSTPNPSSTPSPAKPAPAPAPAPAKAQPQTSSLFGGLSTPTQTSPSPPSAPFTSALFSPLPISPSNARLFAGSPLPASSPSGPPIFASTPPNKPVCNLAAKIKPILDRLPGKIGGLRLEDFARQNQDGTPIA